MNVLIVSPQDQTVGGVASVIVNLARHLHARGHGVFFLHSSRGAFFASQTMTRSGFPGFKLRLGSPFSAERPVLSTLVFFLLLPLILAQIVLLVRRHKIQLINIHYPYPSFVLVAMCRLLVSVKLVTSIHGADIFPNGRARESYHKALRYLLWASDLIVANSHSFQEDFLRLFPQFRQKTIFIYNGVNPTELNVIEKKPPEELGRYVLCIAAHNEKKGLDVLLRAFAEIVGLERDVRLMLAGDGPLRPQLEQLAASLQLNGQVQFVGRQSREEIARLLHGCEVFVLPSRSEPFGIVVIEAMACRRPVVATKSGGIPEIIEDGRSGILVEPDNATQLAAAIRRLLDDPNLQKTIGENGQVRVIRQFLSEKNGLAYEQVFGRLVEPTTA